MTPHLQTYIFMILYRLKPFKQRLILTLEQPENGCGYYQHEPRKESSDLER